MTPPRQPLFTVGGTAPSGPPTISIEHVVTEIEQTISSTGRPIEVRSTAVYRDGMPKIEAETLLQPFNADCGCALRSVRDVVECARCNGLPCRLHSFCCEGGCGLVCCLPCGKATPEGRQCRVCAARDRKAKFWKGLFGLIVKTDDEPTD